MFIYTYNKGDIMIFRKKFNIEQDRLMRKFDIEKRCYYYVKHLNANEYTIINYDDLDRKSKKELLIENKKLLTDDKLYLEEVEKYKEKFRFNYLKKLGFSCDSFEVLSNRGNGSISDDMNQFLDNLLSEDNVLIGIHRVGNNFSKEKMDDIFNNGLKITGHFDGAVDSTKQLNNNVSYYPNNHKIKKELMYADQYKSSVGSILIRIPDEKLEVNNDILLNVNNEIRLNPKYIVGYVPLYQNNTIKNIIYSDAYLNSIENREHKSYQ